MRLRRKHGLRKWACAVGAAALWSASLAAVADVDAGAEFAGPVGVTVPDFGETWQLLQKAAVKEQRQDWKAAAEFYRLVLDQNADRLVPKAANQSDQFFGYFSASTMIGQRLATWPSEGRATYNSLYGGVASTALAGVPGNDTAGLAAVYSRFVGTDAGSTAGVELLESRIEAGEFHVAALGRCLLLHGTLSAHDRAMIHCQVALASHWAGDSTEAAMQLQQLRDECPTETGQLGGHDGILADALAMLLARPFIAPSAVDTNEWPSFAGIAGRGKPSPATARARVRVASMPLAEPDYSALSKFRRDLCRQSDLDTTTESGLFASADAGSIFLQDGRKIYAIDAGTGQALPGWSKASTGDVSKVPGRARNQQLTVTVTPTAVFAVMGQPEQNSAPVKLPGGNAEPGSDTTRIVCVDRRDGRFCWSQCAASLPHSPPPPRTQIFNGTPLVIPGAVDDSVLVTVWCSQLGGSDESYLVSLNTRDGSYRWSTYLGGATRNEYGASHYHPAPMQMTLCEGAVIVMTNQGTVVAVDPASGRLLWCDSYARDAHRPHTLRSLNPIIASGGKIFALPVDSATLMVIDAATGELSASVPTAQIHSADVLIGVRDNAACLTSDNDLYVIDCSTTAAAGSRILWSEPRFASEPGNVVSGRGFATTSSVFVPTRLRLYQFSWDRKRIMSTYPTRDELDGDDGVGNVLVTSGRVWLAGLKNLSAYGDPPAATGPAPHQ